MEEKYCLVKYCKISCPINLDKNGYYSEEEILKKGEEYRKL